MELTVARHCVGQVAGSDLSPFQAALLDEPARVRVVSAPTGAGKSYAFLWAMRNRGERVLFLVPTRRLAQNLVRSLSEDLAAGGWSAGAITRKVALWSSDATQELRRAGFQRVGPYRVRQIASLDLTTEGGEMVVAIPESLSFLLIARRVAAGQPDVGIFDALLAFDHVVFDEFHTIDPRGFGLGAVFAKLAADGVGRARVSFLSATPVELEPVFRRLEIPQEAVWQGQEQLVPDGRTVHGDVRLRLEEAASLAELAERYGAEITAQVREGRQTVLIYNPLVDLKSQEVTLQRTFEACGIPPERVLLINSIDDSRGLSAEPGCFAAGWQQRPEDFDVLVATASVEMGVTFRADLLLMEPGFLPMNFLQRYGRAARGDRPGLVVVRTDDHLRDKNPWLLRLLEWAEQNAGRTVGIQDLTEVLSVEATRRFREMPTGHPAFFGSMPLRAAYTSGLYWAALLRHPSNRGPRGGHLRSRMPGPARAIVAMLAKVRRMADDPLLATSCRDWCDRFERQAETLRNISRRVRVVEGSGQTVLAPELWLLRHTTIPDRFPLNLGRDGEPEFRVTKALSDYILAGSRRYVAQRTVCFPHTQLTDVLPDTPDLPDQWCRLARERDLLGAWECHREAMDAAVELTRCTGLVVTDDETIPVASSSAVF